MSISSSLQLSVETAWRLSLGAAATGMLVIVTLTTVPMEQLDLHLRAALGSAGWVVTFSLSAWMLGAPKSELVAWWWNDVFKGKARFTAIKSISFEKARSALSFGFALWGFGQLFKVFLSLLTHFKVSDLQQYLMGAIFILGYGFYMLRPVESGAPPESPDTVTRSQ